MRALFLALKVKKMVWSHIVSYHVRLTLPPNEIFSVYRCQLTGLPILGHCYPAKDQQGLLLRNTEVFI